VQAVHSWKPVPCILVDLSGVSDFKRMPGAKGLAENEIRGPFDIAHGPLLRFKLYRLAEDDHLFLVVIHHLVADGWSMGVFFHELSVLYAAYLRGDVSPLPELPLQYADYTR